MVRNTLGGNKHKSMARKDMNRGGGRDDKLILSSDPLEIYAMVTKMLGNGMFYAEDQDKTQYLGHIRNKFKGKSKRQNMISVGSVILLGLREWENPHKNGDLIHIYDPHDIESLHLRFPTDQKEELTDTVFDYSHGDTEEIDVAVNATSTSFVKEEMIDFEDI